jgi:hypothetical protein
MAERTLAGQDFGNEIEKAGFDMLAPEMTESNITDALGWCWRKSRNREKSMDHFTDPSFYSRAIGGQVDQP